MAFKMKGPFLFDTLRQAKKKAKKLIKDRFKSGEITREEFKKSKKDIRKAKDIDAGGVPFHESYEPPVKNK